MNTELMIKTELQIQFLRWRSEDMVLKDFGPNGKYKYKLIK